MLDRRLRLAEATLVVVQRVALPGLMLQEGLAPSSPRLELGAWASSATGARVMPSEGFAPTRPCGHRVLSATRLLLRHDGLMMTPAGFAPATLGSVDRCSESAELRGRVYRARDSHPALPPHKRDCHYNNCSARRSVCAVSRRVVTAGQDHLVAPQTEKRMVGFAPTASTLARSRSAAELHPRDDLVVVLSRLVTLASDLLLQARRRVPAPAHVRAQRAADLPPTLLPLEVRHVNLNGHGQDRTDDLRLVMPLLCC
jgi:hypothetical protein